MPLKTSSSSNARGAYIPPEIEKAMADHINQSMPAHLKQYQSSGAYVPEHVEKAMADHMEKTMPDHLQEYINPYLQQNVVSPNAKPNVATPQQQPPVVRPNVTKTISFEPTAAAAPPQAEPIQFPAPDQTSQTPPENAYDFIMNPEKPSRKTNLALPKSLGLKLVVVSGGILALIVVFIIFKSLLSGGGSYTAFIPVVQEQQELIHLTSSITPQQSLSANDLNFNATTQLSVTSSQAALLTYLKTHKVKVSTKQLNLKVSSTVDNQLTTAQTAGTFRQTYEETMLSQLNAYKLNLAQAYKTAGKNGKTLLNDDYVQAQLLINQLQQAAAGSS